eukprot:c42323_g1_i1 orf=35-241(+)
MNAQEDKSDVFKASCLRLTVLSLSLSSIHVVFPISHLLSSHEHLTVIFMLVYFVQASSYYFCSDIKSS